MIVTVNKKTVKNAEFGSIVEPDYDLVGKAWGKIGETETTMTIEILE